MKITAINSQKKRDDRVSVFVDKKYSFSLSKAQLKDEGLESGQELSEPKLRSLKQASEDGKLFDRLLAWLARRPRSIWEVRDYLRRKQAPDDLADKFIAQLEELNYVNDQAFAEAWVRSRRVLKPISQRKLRSELYKKRVDSDIIDIVLEDDETDEHQVLRQLVEKKRKQSRYQDEQKLLAYLARQGFNYSDIRSVLDQLGEEDDSR